MGDVVDAVGDFLESAWDSVESFVTAVWDNVTMPILEEVFSWFGIVDETVVHVQKVSTMVYGDNVDDTVERAIIKAVLGFVKTDTSFFSNYMREVYIAKAQMQAYHRYAELGLYVNGLPTVTAKGGDMDSAAIGTALNTDLGTTNTVLTIDSTFPDQTRYFQWWLQENVTYNYLPYANTLDFTDPWGVARSDYTLVDVVYNAGPNNYSLNISRVAEEALFWIKGPDSVTEGDSAVFTIFSNRAVPVGETVVITLAYSGTAVNAVDYTQVATASMTAGNTEVDVTIATLESATAGSDFTITLTQANINNTGGIFEAVDVYAGDPSVTCSIIDDDTFRLNMNDHYVNESAGTVTIPVTLSSAAGAAFTVDYTFTNGTAVGGTLGAGDYDNTTGTLNFAGTAGEVQNIVVTINSDVVNDDYETFEVGLTNCSDAGLDITASSTITILDGTFTGPTPGTVLLQDTITAAAYLRERSLIVAYHLSTDPSTDWFYWIYPFSAGTYPGLEPTMSTINNLEMMPMAILRKDKTSITNTPPNETYRTTRLLIQKLRLELRDVIDNIEANPDIAVIDDVFINFSMSPSSNNRIVSRLLYRSFEVLFVTHGLTSNINQYTISLEEGDVNNAIVWTGYEIENNLAGSVCPVGEYIHVVDATNAGAYTHAVTPESALIMRHQHTINLYDEIRIYNLNGMAAIAYAAHHNMAVNRVQDTDFTIPVSWFLVDELTPKEQLEVYQYLLRLDVYCITVQELDWYETSTFLNLFEFVLTVITIATLGTAGSVTAALYQLAIHYLVMELVVFIAEETGNAELAAVIGLVASIALSGGDFNFTSFIEPTQLIELSTEFATNLAVGYDTVSQGIAEDINNINQMAEDRLEEIGDTNPDPLIDPAYMAAINSVNTTSFPAIQAQYSFDSTYDYDMLVSNFFETRLQIGVI